MASLIPEVPEEIPRTSGVIAAWIGRGIMRLMKWRVVGVVPREPKLVLIVAPHTSAFDFIIGLAAKWALRLETSYLAKESLFRWPLSILMRRTGGIPVDRSTSHNLVERMADLFAARQQMVLTIAPEGTRQRVDVWRTGFYRIAEAASVPILPVALHYGDRRIEFGPTLTPTGDADGDMAKLRARYAGIARRDD